LIYREKERAPGGALELSVQLQDFFRSADVAREADDTPDASGQEIAELFGDGSPGEADREQARGAPL
jgi:hypothetical protein